jgi:hypothetical protein
MRTSIIALLFTKMIGYTTKDQKSWTNSTHNFRDTYKLLGTKLEGKRFLGRP